MTIHEEYIKLIAERYGQYKDGNYEEEQDYYWILEAPANYENEEETLKYLKKHPKATLKEVIRYWDDITPDGLAPNDDGSDLLEDDDE